VRKTLRKEKDNLRIILANILTEEEGGKKIQWSYNIEEKKKMEY